MGHVCHAVNIDVVVFLVAEKQRRIEESLKVFTRFCLLALCTERRFEQVTTTSHLCFDRIAERREKFSKYLHTKIIIRSSFISCSHGARYYWFFEMHIQGFVGVTLVKSMGRKWETTIEVV